MPPVKTDQPLKPIFHRLMVPLVLALLVLMAGFFAAQTSLHHKQLNSSHAQAVEKSLLHMENRFADLTRLLGELQRVVMADVELVNLLKYQQRAQLIQTFQPQFERLLGQGITHFYFHKPDGINLVRLHQPQRFGDRITRWTMQQSLATGKIASGMEMGPLNNLTLRVVQPVVDSEQIIGYMELGIELETILATNQRADFQDIALLIRKHAINRANWERSHENNEHLQHSSWDRYSQSVLTFTSNPVLADLLDNFEQHGQGDQLHFHALDDLDHEHELGFQHRQERAKTYEVHLAGQASILTIIPFKDVVGEVIADLVLLHDVSPQTANFRYWITMTAGVSLLAFVLLTASLYRFLRNVDKGILHQQRELVRYTDTLQKARAVTKDGIWDWDLKAKTMKFDTRFYTMAGYQADEFAANLEHWLELIHVEDVAHIETAINDFIAGNCDVFDHEFRLRCKNGEYIWVRSRALIFDYDDDGKPLHVVGIHTNISQRKKAQKSLQKSEQKYRLLVENQSDLVVEVDPQGHFLFVSPSYCRLFGKSEEELLGQRFMPLVHEDDQEATRRAMELLFRPPYNCYLEQRAMATDGWHWLGWMDNAILDDKGQVRSIIGVGRDITERRQMEQQLRESEERFSKAFYQLDIAMELVQIDQGTRVDFNDKYCELTGYSRDELLDSSIYDKNLWINPEGQIKAAEELKQTGTLSGYPMDIVTKSGTRKNLLLSAAKLYLSREQDIAIAALVDITHLKQAEAALRESEARFRAVFNQQYQFMAILDPDGKTIAINDLPLLTGGYDRTQFVGEYFWDSPAWQALPEWHEIWQQRLHQVAETQQAVHTEDVYETVDGTRRYADSSTSAILDPEGQVQYYLIEATDTTERRQAEAQRDELLQQVQQLNRDLEKRVEQRTAELKAVNKELEAFSYSVSHDLRAPLRSIDGFSQALLEDYASQLDGDGQDYLNRVRNNAQRMGQLIDDMLQLSRVSRDDMRREDVDMREIALQVIETLRESDPDRQVDLTLGPLLATHGDPRMIRIMLDNLLGNAWKFTAKRDRAEIVFERVESGADLFQIRDNGVGFDMQHAHKLFGAFQRLHGIKEFPGTGIGLATVQRIVDRHGGRVWAQAAPDQGATFYFTLSADSSSEND